MLDEVFKDRKCAGLKASPNHKVPAKLLALCSSSLLMGKSAKPDIQQPTSSSVSRNTNVAYINEWTTHARLGIWILPRWFCVLHHLLLRFTSTNFILNVLLNESDITKLNGRAAWHVHILIRIPVSRFAQPHSIVKWYAAPAVKSAILLDLPKIAFLFALENCCLPFSMNYYERRARTGCDVN